MTSMSQEAIDLLDSLCSRAVETIVSAKYDESIGILTHALKTFQQEQLLLSQKEDEEDDDMEIDTSSMDISTLQYYKSETSPKEPIFTAPLVVPCDDDTNNRETTASTEQWQFVITYNLALSYHLCAMAQRDAKKLEVALGLWDLIYRFHWNENLGLATFHTCAILNNYGHGLRQVGADKPARECFESLLCALCVCVQNKGELSSSPSGVDACRIECFYRNISPLVLRNPQTAGAA
ncbi:MAG: hypothetical protein SGILL_008879 [Bacillariaceae sp.]